MKMTTKQLLLCLLSLMLIISAVSCAPAQQTPDGDDSGDPPVQDGPSDGENTTGGEDDGGVTWEDFDPQVDYPMPDYQSMPLMTYVKMGQFRNLIVTIDPKETEVTEEQLQEVIDELLIMAQRQVTDRETTWGDIVVASYVGKIDGVAFSGGSAENVTITLSEDSGYIPGFAEGLVGMMPGTSQDVPVTFPENYHNADYAGKEAVFTMTLHYVVETPTLTDDFVVEYSEGKYQTVEAFRATLREELELQAYDNAVYVAVWYAILGNFAVLDYPDQAVLYYYQYYYDMYNVYAQYYGLDFETYITYMGMTPQQLWDSCVDRVKYELIRYAVFAAMDCVCDEQQYQDELTRYTEDNYADLAAYMQSMGYADFSFEEAKEYFDEVSRNDIIASYLDALSFQEILSTTTVQYAQEEQ